MEKALYIMVLENLAGKKTVESPGDSQEVVFPSSPFPEENILKPYLNYNFRMENKSELFMLWKSHVHKQRKIREGRNPSQMDSVSRAFYSGGQATT